MKYLYYSKSQNFDGDGDGGDCEYAKYDISPDSLETFQIEVLKCEYFAHVYNCAGVPHSILILSYLLN